MRIVSVQGQLFAQLGLLLYLLLQALVSVSEVNKAISNLHVNSLRQRCCDMVLHIVQTVAGLVAKTSQEGADTSAAYEEGQGISTELKDPHSSQSSA
jgi:hypothetical protein